MEYGIWKQHAYVLRLRERRRRRATSQIRLDPAYSSPVNLQGGSQVARTRSWFPQSTIQSNQPHPHAAPFPSTACAKPPGELVSTSTFSLVATNLHQTAAQPQVPSWPGSDGEQKGPRTRSVGPTADPQLETPRGWRSWHYALQLEWDILPLGEMKTKHRSCRSPKGLFGCRAQK